MLTEDDKKTYKAIILLNELINGDHKFQTVANGDDKILEPLFIELMSKGYVQTAGLNYDVAPKGKEVFDNFMLRYTEYLKVYDVYSFVDLEKGEFAFSRYFDFDSDAAWDNFKNDQRFDDMRIAVAQFKKLNPADIVFMSFINENRFDTSSTGWQMDLVSSNTWTEIESIVSTAIQTTEVQEDAMVDMIKQGTELMISLMEEEARQRKEDEQNNNGNDNGQQTTVYETVEHYEPYYDPWYVSPIWMVPLFLW
ncbi:hypothetical protein [Pedobacter cryoconitis]|uniref:Uncharacterized protein n=1 Tax=Pedobacter cryoconitis TaxID=188932 RepID=A0A7X0J5U2_9SPHI|nr:hypothetical protein [Pedobacter cryoconitis]MBB6501204.1 hypothetical protein [Pedobacter cryoconitis]